MNVERSLEAADSRVRVADERISHQAIVMDELRFVLRGKKTRRRRRRRAVQDMEEELAKGSMF